MYARQAYAVSNVLSREIINTQQNHNVSDLRFCTISTYIFACFYVICVLPFLYHAFYYKYGGCSVCEIFITFHRHEVLQTFRKTIHNYLLVFHPNTNNGACYLN